MTAPLTKAELDQISVELSRQRTGMANVIARVNAPRNLGIALVSLGIGMLILGIGYHIQFMTALRKTRAEMAAEPLIHGKSPFPPSLTLITAAILLVLGIAVIVSMLT